MSSVYWILGTNGGINFNPKYVESDSVQYCEGKLKELDRELKDLKPNSYSGLRPSGVNSF